MGQQTWERETKQTQHKGFITSLQHTGAASRPQTDTLKFKTIAKTLSCVKTRKINRKKQEITELLLKQLE